MELVAAVQNYAWGIKGISSSVAKYAKTCSPNVEIDENLPYAELWMGTHKSGPSLIRATGESLGSFIEKHEDCLGANILKAFGKQLCFLFKVLSVNQSLSIQAHPNKKHAEQLHKDQPHLYRDPNHKPEMAIGLTPFHALCGFRPSIEIQKYFAEIPELVDIIGEDNAASFTLNPSEDTLKECFSALMVASQDSVEISLNKFADRLYKLDCDTEFMKSTFLKLLSEYPADGGCFAIYFLNYVVLQPGEAMFLGSNVIHAYLSGDCIECMACSDNVVRAGLTPKYKDVETLLAMLEYQMGSAEERKFGGYRIDQFTVVFNPPVNDFAVQKIEGHPRDRITVTRESSASILIVIQGTGSDLEAHPCNLDSVATPECLEIGSILFLSSEQTVAFTVKEEFLAFRALCLS